MQSDLREYAAARRSHEGALAIRREALPKGHPDIAQSLDSLGNVQYVLRDYAAAKKSHEEALAIRRKALPEGHPDTATSLSNLGLVQYDLGEYAAARASYEEALAIYRKARPPEDPDITTTLSRLGNVQRGLGDYAAARRSVEDALAILRKALAPDDPRIADSLNNLGVVQADLGEYAAARKSYEEALAIYRKALPPEHPDIADSLNNLGIVQEELAEYAAAKRSYEEALAIQRKAWPEGHPHIAGSLYNLGLLNPRREADPREALPRLAEATDLYLAEQSRLAVAQAEQEQLAAAGRAHLCLNLLLAAVLAGGGDAGAAYDRAVRVKGSVTAQQRWARRLRDAADPDTARLLDRLRHVSRQLTALALDDPQRGDGQGPRDLAGLIRSMSAERDELERQMGQRSDLYRAFRAQAQTDGAEVRAALPEGTALLDLVEYSQVTLPAGGQGEPAEELRLAAFVVRPEQRGVALVPLGPSRELADLVERWRASYGRGKAPPAGEPDPASALRRRLWEPLEPHLRGATIVLVSPDGPLHGLPLAALPGAKAGTFLVHERAFAVAPIPQLLPDMLRQPPPAAGPPSLLLAGGIDFGQGPAREAGGRAGDLPPVPVFPPLPGTEGEVNDLRAQFEDAFPDAPPPKVLRKGRATKEAVLAAAPACRFVHLATHGFFADEAQTSALAPGQRAGRLRGGLSFRAEAVGRHPGLLSGVVFAGVNRPDRRPEETILTALEGGELDLGRVELVVLSACDTGRGRVAGGEGVLGLQPAFQVAGARATMASLWKVPDRATRELMGRFYRNLWHGQDGTPMGKLAALREAQLWLLTEGPRHPELLRGGLQRPEPTWQEGDAAPPFYWAAFALAGDWR